jgi:methionyl-tRNA synthetase
LNFTAEESKLIEEFNNSTKIMQNLMENFLIRKSFLVIQEKCDVINKFIGKTEVWKVRDETTKNKIIYIILEMIRITSLLLESFVPSLSANILNALQIKENHRKVENLMFRSFKTKDENFHHEKDQNIFLKVNLDDKTNFFRKKFDVVKN